jgi:hypothetical protein
MSGFASRPKTRVLPNSTQGMASRRSEKRNFRSRTISMKASSARGAGDPRRRVQSVWERASACWKLDAKGFQFAYRIPEYDNRTLWMPTSGLGPVASINRVILGQSWEPRHDALLCRPNAHGPCPAVHGGARPSNGRACAGCNGLFVVVNDGGPGRVACGILPPAGHPNPSSPVQPPQ